MHTEFKWGNLREGDHLEDPGIDGSLILNCTSQKQDGGGGGTDWIGLAQDKDRWRTLANAVVNLRVP
jgi:hypothetical protein